MNKSLSILILSLSLTGCSAYWADQTTDDLYYSPHQATYAYNNNNNEEPEYYNDSESYNNFSPDLSLYAPAYNPYPSFSYDPYYGGYIYSHYYDPYGYTPYAEHFYCTPYSYYSPLDYYY